jgi:hypothetical protein
MDNKEEPHQCKDNRYKDVEIRHEKINREEWSWVLESTWYATETEVEDGLATEEGIPLHSDSLLIAFCPFCGENLLEKQKNTW